MTLDTDTWHMTTLVPWHLTLYTWRLTYDTWHMTLNTWHFTHDTWHSTNGTLHMTLDTWNLTHNTWHMTLDTAGFEEFSNIRMGAIVQTKFLSNGNQMHQLQQKITSRQQFVDWTTWPCLKKVFLHFAKALVQRWTLNSQSNHHHPSPTTTHRKLIEGFWA